MNIKKQLAWSVGLGMALFFLLTIVGLVMTATIPEGQVANKSIALFGLPIVEVVSDQDGFVMSTGLGLVVVPVLVMAVTFFGSLLLAKVSKGGPRL